MGGGVGRAQGRLGKGCIRENVMEGEGRARESR